MFYSLLKRFIKYTLELKRTIGSDRTRQNMVKIVVDFNVAMNKQDMFYSLFYRFIIYIVEKKRTIGS